MADKDWNQKVSKATCTGFLFILTGIVALALVMFGLWKLCEHYNITEDDLDIGHFADHGLSFSDEETVDPGELVIPEELYKQPEEEPETEEYKPFAILDDIAPDTRTSDVFVDVTGQEVHYL